MLSIVIQAGGESQRMGQDKALMHFLGRPLIQRIIDRVTSLADELLIITNRPEDYAFLNLPMAADILPGRGSLGGLYTALKISSRPYTAVVACDMPFVNAPLLAVSRDLLLQEDAGAVIPKTEMGIEPFHAIYNRALCLPAAEIAVKSGKWRVDSWFSSVPVYYLMPEEIARLDPLGVAFLNLNTPEEFQQAEKLAKELDAT